MKLFDEAMLRSFICDILEVMFTTLVNMFYSNLNNVDGVLPMKFINNNNRLSIKEFDEICNLPYTGSNCKAGEEGGNDFSYIPAAISFLENSNSSIPSPFKVITMLLDLFSLITWKHILLS